MRKARCYWLAPSMRILIVIMKIGIMVPAEEVTSSTKRITVMTILWAGDNCQQFLG